MQSERLNYLDSLRGIAACIVLLTHCWNASEISLDGGLAVAFHSLSNFIHYSIEKVLAGRASVMIFFVLSGFVLTYSLQKQPLLYKNYTIKRIFRIYPAFFIVILASYALHIIIGAPYETDNVWLKTNVVNPDITWIAFWKNLIFFGTTSGLGLNMAAWSLVHEIRISLLFPLILLSVKNYGWRAVVSWGAASLASPIFAFYFMGYILTGNDEATFITSLLATINFIVFFAAGAFLCIERQKIAPFILLLGRWKKLILFAIVVTCLLKSGHERESLIGISLTDYINGLGAFGIIALLLGVRKFQTVLNHRFPIWLGRVSYSLYLVHIPIIYTISQTISRGNLAVSDCLLVIALSLIIAELIVKTVELPGIKLGKRLAPSPRATT